jgi:ligand-binding sensor domain-containing protein/signal transduction histidine kinase
VNIIKRRVNALSCALFLCALLAGSLSVPAEQLPVKAYTIADGLAHDEIRKIFQDSHGFLWFCTADGLSRFDGSSFTTYMAKDGLAFSYVDDMLESRRGVYWIATNGGGVSRLNPSANGRDGGLFTTYSLGDDTSNRINALLEDHLGNIWAGSDNGLFRLNDGDINGTFQRVELNFNAGPPQALGIQALVEDDDSHLWIGSSQGLVRRLPDGRAIQYPIQPPQSVDYVWALLKDKDGRIWAGHQSGLLVFKPAPATPADTDDSFYELIKRKKQTGTANSQLTRTSLPASFGEARWYTVADGLAYNSIHALFQSGDGRVWIGTRGGGLSVLGDEHLHNYTTAQGLNNKIGALAEDHDGNLWVGTQASGAMKIARSGLLSYGMTEGLGTPEVINIFEDQAGELIVITTKWTINRFDGEKFTSVRPNLPQSLIDSSSGRWEMMQDHLGEWWVATNQGLYRFPKVNRIEDLARVRPLAVYATPDGLADNYISRLFEDSRGDIWIGTFHPPETLTRWERSTETFHRYSEKDGLPPQNWPNVFAEDRAGNLWIGLHNGGMARYRDNRFEIFGAAEGIPIGLSQGLYFDHAGRLWMAVRAKGTGRIDDPTASVPRATPFATADKLSSENLWCFTEDRAGFIYIGTERGMDKLNASTGQVKHFTTADGLIKSQVNAAFRDRQGALWFGTPEGLSRLLQEPDLQRPPPTVLISKLRIAGVARPVSELGVAEVPQLELNPDQNQLQIDFFSIEFGAGETIRYQYMLEGADKNWSVPTEQRTINYSNLASGSYRFLVRAVNADGMVSLRPATISFRVLPPFWLRWWFIALAVLVFGSIVFAFDRYRIARLDERRRAEEALRRSREERLRELERVRTRIATDLHDDIGSSLTQIVILSEVAQQQVNGTDGSLAEPLTKITTVSNELVEAMSDIVWAINPKKDHLSDLVQRMRRFASDIFAPCQIRLNLRALDADDRLQLGANIRRELFLIFKECVNNIAKHSGCTEAKVEFYQEGDSLILKLSDNGKGFDMAAMSEYARTLRGGNGLLSMRRRAEELGGTFAMISTVGEGTSVILKVPLGQQSILESPHPNGR